MEIFSKRFGHSHPDAEITIRDSAPEALRHAVIAIAYECGMTPGDMRKLVCNLLRKAPDSNNWSPSNVEFEVQGLVEDCEWFEVYDLIEAISRQLMRSGLHPSGQPASVYFQTEIDRYFRKAGIGWQFSGGQLVIRGPEAFEYAVGEARDELARHGRQTSAGELHEAIRDLSRRPTPEITGAIQHAMAALECVSRDTVHDASATLGTLVKRHPNLFPPPIDQIVSMAWGYSSNFGRHLQEGKPPEFADAELMVGLSGVLSRYLLRRFAS